MGNPWDPADIPTGRSLASPPARLLRNRDRPGPEGGVVLEAAAGTGAERWGAHVGRPQASEGCGRGGTPPGTWCPGSRGLGPSRREVTMEEGGRLLDICLHLVASAGPAVPTEPRKPGAAERGPPRGQSSPSTPVSPV